MAVTEQVCEWLNRQGMTGRQPLQTVAIFTHSSHTVYKEVWEETVHTLTTGWHCKGGHTHSEEQSLMH